MLGDVLRGRRRTPDNLGKWEARMWHNRSAKVSHRGLVGSLCGAADGKGVQIHACITHTCLILLSERSFGPQFACKQTSKGGSLQNWHGNGGASDIVHSKAFTQL